MRTICDDCLYNEGEEEYEENKIGLFCSHPEIKDYIDAIRLNCSLKKLKL